jgi:hypothetical protein
MALDLKKIKKKFNDLLGDSNFVTDFKQWLEARTNSKQLTNDYLAINSLIIEPKMELNLISELTAEDLTSCQPITKLNVKYSKTVRAKITRILYQNSIDDSECIRIKFERIDGVINEIMLCVE